MTRFLIAYTAAMVAIVFLAGAVAGHTPAQTIAELFGLLARAAEYGVRIRT